MKKMQYLLWFAHEHVEFRFAEIQSLLSLFNINMEYIYGPTESHPYCIVQFKNNEKDAKLLTSRSVSLRSCIELWSHTETVELLHKNLKEFPVEYISKHFNPNKSFKIDVETFGRHFSQKEKVDKIETFNYLPIKGPVSLKNPDVCLNYIEYYGTDPNTAPLTPYCVFFGRLVANGLRQLIQKLSLKTRKFIGNTTMDSQLSLLMANQAKIKNGDLILDPFVGSGSLLVAAAQFGGFVFGTDIDYLMLHGRTRPSRIKQKVRDKNESIKANMEQYNLEDKYLDVLINDFAMPFWRENLIFDAIITDPPYGIREATEKIGTTKENFILGEEFIGKHIPAKIDYGISDIYRDLLVFSAKQLKLGGRLVCWFPVFRENYKSEELPSHPCLNLVANSEQILSKTTSRRLLTFEKIKEPTERDIQVDDFKIGDFREKYYQAREETRSIRRTREAQIREENRLRALEKNIKF